MEKVYPVVFLVALALVAGYMFGSSRGKIADNAGPDRQHQQQSFRQALSKLRTIPKGKIKVVNKLDQVKEQGVIYVIKDKSDKLNIAYAYIVNGKTLTGYVELDGAISDLLDKQR